MMGVFRKAFLAGMGAVSLSSEHASKMVGELVKAGELHEKDGLDLVEEMVKKAAEVKKEVESTIAKQLDAAYKRMKLVSLDQLEQMESRLQQLEKRLTQASRPARSKKPTASPAKRTGKKTAKK
jgi:polyhydroxyalkanoate synthesis regulator phasin